MCVHTWPEQRAVTLGGSVCNFGVDPSAKALDNGRVCAKCYTGRWVDVGTPERLEQLSRWG